MFFKDRFDINGLLTYTSHSQIPIKEDTETVLIHRSQHHCFPRLQAMIITTTAGITAVAKANKFTLFLAR